MFSGSDLGVFHFTSYEHTVFWSAGKMKTLKKQGAMLGKISPDEDKVREQHAHTYSIGNNLLSMNPYILLINHPCYDNTACE